MSTPEQQPSTIPQSVGQTPETFVQSLGIDPTTVVPVGDAFEEGVEDLVPEDDSTEAKSDREFRVVFKPESGKKILPGSGEITELIRSLTFPRTFGEVTDSEEEAPKKRGRKSNAEKEGVDRTISLELWDDVQNAAVDFIETLPSTENFRFFLYAVATDALGNRVDLERFTFKGCSVKPLKRMERWTADDSVIAKPRTLPVQITFTEMKRASLVTASAEQE